MIVYNRIEIPGLEMPRALFRYLLEVFRRRKSDDRRRALIGRIHPLRAPVRVVCGGFDGKQQNVVLQFHVFRRPLLCRGQAAGPAPQLEQEAVLIGRKVDDFLVDELVSHLLGDL